VSPWSVMTRPPERLDTARRLQSVVFLIGKGNESRLFGGCCSRASLTAVIVSGQHLANIISSGKRPAFGMRARCRAAFVRCAGCKRDGDTSHFPPRRAGSTKFIAGRYQLPHGRGCGVGRSLGIGFGRGVGVGRTVAVGVGVGVAVGVTVGVRVGVGVGLVAGVVVAVAVGVAVGVASDPTGARTLTEIGEPVLKNPMFAVVSAGGPLESNRKLYNVPKRIAFAFWFSANVWQFQAAELKLLVKIQGSLLYPALFWVPSFAKPGC
jgi:hypothetical protein